MQWRPMLPKGGGMIQVDIGGHSPIHLGPHHCYVSFFSVSLIVAQFTIFGNFLGPEI